MSALKDTDPHVRTLAAQSLGEIGPKSAASPTVIEGLRGMLTSGEKLAVLRALAKFGPAAEPAIPRLFISSWIKIQSFVGTRPELWGRSVQPGKPRSRILSRRSKIATQEYANTQLKPWETWARLRRQRYRI